MTSGILEIISRLLMMPIQYSSVQSHSHVRLFATPWTAAHQASLSIINSQSLPKLMSIESVMQPSHPLSSPSPPALNLSQHQGLFQWVNSSHQVAKITGVSASTSVLPMNTHDWSPLGWTGWSPSQSKGLSRVLQQHSSKASILWCSGIQCSDSQFWKVILHL